MTGDVRLEEACPQALLARDGMEEVDEIRSLCGRNYRAGDERTGSGANPDHALLQLRTVCCGNTDVVAQSYPVPPPVSLQATFVLTPPPPPEVEVPPPAPSPTYVWEPGHWYWNGLQYHWQPGKYIVKPTEAATYKPGHWEQRPEGWVWVASQWTYGTEGSGE